MLDGRDGQCTASLRARPSARGSTNRVRHKQGHWAWVEASFSLVHDVATEQRASTLCSIRGISERKAQADEPQPVNADLERFHLTSELHGRCPWRILLPGAGGQPRDA